MSKIAVLGGTGYLASIIKNQNNCKKNNFFFFSRKKSSKNFLNYKKLNNHKNILKKFDIIIYLVGPNYNEIKKKKSLLKKKNIITNNVCDFCLNHNIKLIYISSIQVYKEYGIKNISLKSKINLLNSYAQSHYESEKIIIKKFSENKKMYIILRLANVFGFNSFKNLREIQNNLIHDLCVTAFKKKKIIIQKGFVQRSFVPSNIFIKVINLIINKNFFNNSIYNICYKNYYLSDIAKILKEKFKSLFNLDVYIQIKGKNYQKKFQIYTNKPFKFVSSNKKIYSEIEQLLKVIKKNLNIKL